VNFSYHEAGEDKQALVKLVACERCAEKLYYKKRKEGERSESKEKKKQKRKRYGERDRYLITKGHSFVLDYIKLNTH
jgi:uncharacterized protein YbaR (Trm112 family)